MTPCSRGSSPRERGTLQNQPQDRLSRRFIPAGAGNAFPPELVDRAKAVHPRGSGERDVIDVAVSPGSGSSPRERGTLDSGRGVRRVIRFIPAGAGNASRVSRSRMRAAVHPRGSGERRRSPAGCRSPRRFIPAGAGNAAPARRPGRPRSVHPRGSGERAWVRASPRLRAGSSPRERGTRRSPTW